jgi:tRNA(Ile2) C34 agmatinyltransferase TiaS
VLDAFVIVDHGLNETTNNYASKNEGLYGKIDFEYAQNQAKAGEWKVKSDSVKQMAEELFAFINECKVQIVEINDPEAIHDGKVALEEVNKKDDTNTPGEVMIVKGKGHELEERINAFRKKMIGMIHNPEEYEKLIEALGSTQF